MIMRHPDRRIHKTPSCPRSSACLLGSKEPPQQARSELFTIASRSRNSFMAKDGWAGPVVSPPGLLRKTGSLEIETVRNAA
uniref:Uncharacterized protein n=1 Tax=Panagrellus redivivus TaxID=6233 RepID=A0A7E4WD26_PANRE